MINFGINALAPTNIYRPSKIETVGDIANVNQNKDIATVSQNKSVRPSKSKQKNWFSDDKHIQDAKYHEMTNEILDELEYEPHYVSDGFRTEKSTAKTAPKRISMTKQTTEPASIQAISLQKRKTRSQLVQKEPEYPSKARNNNRDDPNWLINQMFECMVGTGKVVGKAGKTVAKTAGKAVGEGFKIIDQGATAFGNSTIGKNLNHNAEVEYAHLRSAGRRARGSIIATGNKRAAGSLVKQHSFGTTNTTYNTQTNAGATLYGVTARYEKGIGNRVELHYYYRGQRVTHDNINYILSKQQINQLKKAAKNAILGVQANIGSTKPVRPNTTVNKPVFNNGTRKVLSQPKTTTASGLVRRNKSGVV
jgi:hypothetical protein